MNGDADGEASPPGINQEGTYRDTTLDFFERLALVPAELFSSLAVFKYRGYGEAPQRIATIRRQINFEQFQLEFGEGVYKLHASGTGGAGCIARDDQYSVGPPIERTRGLGGDSLDSMGGSAVPSQALSEGRLVDAVVERLAPMLRGAQSSPGMAVDHGQPQRGRVYTEEDIERLRQEADKRAEERYDRLRKEDEERRRRDEEKRETEARFERLAQELRELKERPAEPPKSRQDELEHEVRLTSTLMGTIKELSDLTTKSRSSDERRKSDLETVLEYQTKLPQLFGEGGSRSPEWAPALIGEIGSLSRGLGLGFREVVQGNQELKKLHLEAELHRKRLFDDLSYREKLIQLQQLGQGHSLPAPAQPPAFEPMQPESREASDDTQDQDAQEDEVALTVSELFIRELVARGKDGEKPAQAIDLALRKCGSTWSGDDPDDLFDELFNDLDEHLGLDPQNEAEVKAFAEFVVQSLPKLKRGKARKYMDEPEVRTWVLEAVAALKGLSQLIEQDDESVIARLRGYVHA